MWLWLVVLIPNIFSDDENITDLFVKVPPSNSTEVSPEEDYTKDDGLNVSSKDENTTNISPKVPPEPKYTTDASAEVSPEEEHTTDASPEVPPKEEHTTGAGSEVPPEEHTTDANSEVPTEDDHGMDVSFDDVHHTDDTTEDEDADTTPAPPEPWLWVLRQRIENTAVKFANGFKYKKLCKQGIAMYTKQRGYWKCNEDHDCPSFYECFGKANKTRHCCPLPTLCEEGTPLSNRSGIITCHGDRDCPAHVECAIGGNSIGVCCASAPCKDKTVMPLMLELNPYPVLVECLSDGDCKKGFHCMRESYSLSFHCCPSEHVFQEHHEDDPYIQYLIKQNEERIKSRMEKGRNLFYLIPLCGVPFLLVVATCCYQIKNEKERFERNELVDEWRRARTRIARKMPSADLTPAEFQFKGVLKLHGEIGDIKHALDDDLSQSLNQVTLDPTLNEVVVIGSAVENIDDLLSEQESTTQRTPLGSRETIAKKVSPGRSVSKLKGAPPSKKVMSQVKEPPESAEKPSPPKPRPQPIESESKIDTKSKISSVEAPSSQMDTVRSSQQKPPTSASIQEEERTPKTQEGRTEPSTGETSSPENSDRTNATDETQNRGQGGSSTKGTAPPTTKRPTDVTVAQRPSAGATQNRGQDGSSSEGIVLPITKRPTDVIVTQPPSTAATAATKRTGKSPAPPQSPATRIKEIFGSDTRTSESEEFSRETQSRRTPSTSKVQKLRQRSRRQAPK
ncbi:hypothetical protein V3C99_000083 [Haemonchus contortus]